MADDASRLQHLTDTQFLSHFSSQHPQHKPWQLVHAPPGRKERAVTFLARMPVVGSCTLAAWWIALVTWVDLAGVALSKCSGLFFP